MSSPRRIRPELILALFIAGACGGGGGGGGGGGITPPPPTPPAATATLSGTVSEEREGAALPGATITLGSATVTAGSNGTFTMQNAPVGAGTVTVKAAGYDQFTKSVTLVAGSNQLVPTLVRVNTVYRAGSAVIYVPTEVTTIRGVFLYLFGGNLDGRPMVQGDIEPYRDYPLSGDVLAYRRRMMEFARANGLAVMGVEDGAAILPALTDLAAVSGHPELAQAPIVVHGHSSGACTAYDLAGREPARTIGFIAAKASCAQTSPPRIVPGYLIMSLNDPQLSSASLDAVRKAFETQRAKGAPWALLLDPVPGHQVVTNLDLLFNWMQDVVTRRLPPTPAPGAPVVLRTIDDPSGWLGEPTSFAIADYPCYVGDRLAASWLPSKQTARDWQAMVSGGATQAIMAC